MCSQNVLCTQIVIFIKSNVIPNTNCVHIALLYVYAMVGVNMKPMNKSIKLNQEIIAEIRKIANEEDRTFSAVIRIALKNYIQKYRENKKEK